MTTTPEELTKLNADIAFYDEVLAAIQSAGAKRQALTHAPHPFSADDRQIIELVELKKDGAMARKRRIEIVGR